jgi:hypothetical protein
VDAGALVVLDHADERPGAGQDLRRIGAPLGRPGHVGHLAVIVAVEPLAQELAVRRLAHAGDAHLLEAELAGLTSDGVRAAHRSRPRTGRRCPARTGRARD